MGKHLCMILSVVSVILALFTANIHAAGGKANVNDPDQERSARTGRKQTDYVINAQAGSVAGIALGMTENEIREVGWPYETKSEIIEGDEYKIYYLHLPGNVHLKCTLDLENTLYTIESSSVEVRDEHGLGVESRLGDLKNAYITGRFIKGTAEGRFANFLTGTHLIFYFDPEDLDDACFDSKKECSIDDDIRVESISIGRYKPR